MEVGVSNAGGLGEAMGWCLAGWRGEAKVSMEEGKVQAWLQVGDPVQIHRNREGQSAQTPDSTVVTIEGRGSQSLLTKPRFHRRAKRTTQVFTWYV